MTDDEFNRETERLYIQASRTAFLMGLWLGAVIALVARWVLS